MGVWTGRLFRILGVGALGVIAVLSLVPGTLRPHTGASGNLEHCMAYAGTAFLLALGFRLRSMVLIAVGLSVAAGGFELLQFFVPGRQPGLDNWAASSLGGVLGVTAAFLLNWRRSTVTKTL